MSSIPIPPHFNNPLLLISFIPCFLPSSIYPPAHKQSDYITSKTCSLQILTYFDRDLMCVDIFLKPSNFLGILLIFLNFSELWSELNFLITFFVMPYWVIQSTLEFTIDIFHVESSIPIFKTLKTVELFLYIFSSTYTKWHNVGQSKKASWAIFSRVLGICILSPLLT